MVSLKQQLYSQSGVDAVDASNEVVVCFIVSILIYPLAKNNQPHYRAISRPLSSLLVDVHALRKT
jgi:hypothetical protein